MANTTFSGPVISKNGFFNTGPGNIKTLNTSTSRTVADHAGRIVLNNSAGAVTFTLPALNATANAGVAGPTDYNNLNNLGASFEIFASITKTGSLIVQVANANDVMVGGAKFIDDTSDNMVGFETGSTSDTITLNGSTTGGTFNSGTSLSISASPINNGYKFDKWVDNTNTPISSSNPYGFSITSNLNYKGLFVPQDIFSFNYSSKNLW